MSRQAAHKAITASLVNIEADMDHAAINRFEAVAARQQNKTEGILDSMRGAHDDLKGSRAGAAGVAPALEVWINAAQSEMNKSAFEMDQELKRR